MKDEITYFEIPGKKNTEETLQIVRESALKYGVKKILLASTTGYTALLAADILKNDGVEIITVGIDTYGWSQEEERRKELENANLIVLPCTDYLKEDVANILRCFSQGVKVALEIAFMASNAGMILPDTSTIIAVAGSGFGADTALLLKSVVKNNKIEYKVNKILCMPGEIS